MFLIINQTSQRHREKTRSKPWGLHPCGQSRAEWHSEGAGRSSHEADQQGLVGSQDPRSLGSVDKKKFISQSRKKKKIFIRAKLRIITQEQPLRMLPELFCLLDRGRSTVVQGFKTRGLCIKGCSWFTWSRAAGTEWAAGHGSSGPEKGQEGRLSSRRVLVLAECCSSWLSRYWMFLLMGRLVEACCR